MHRKIEETPEREKMLIRLKELRLERGYSMTQAARKIFSHPDTYNRYEKGIRDPAGFADAAGEDVRLQS